MNMPTLYSHTHWQVAPVNPRPKLAKEYVRHNARKKKAQAQNNVYKALGNKWLN